ncbi:MAG: adenylate kinase [Candidatus Latescibacteria bacterium]|nr:adenylate kinase [bacterium]MBD3425441.1 adenylate kinase [Candidatus Latescibacterota bacterium]
MSTNLIILGPPGAGKGTQAVRIAEEMELKHLSTGDLLREEVAEGTELGSKAREFMNRGELVPDELILSMIAVHFDGQDSRGWILDGFPRSLNQARALSDILREKGIELDNVILLDISPETVISRITGRRVCSSCGAVYNISSMEGDRCTECGGELIIRDDDREETVRRRFEVYRKQTEPLIEYYSGEEGLMLKVDAGAGIDEITESILDGIKEA